MKLFNILFYHYYLFYTKVIVEDEPYATTVFTLSVSEGFLINYLIDFIGANYFCQIPLGKWGKIVIVVLIILLNYIYYMRGGMAKKIVTDKPSFFGNRGFSIGLTMVFFVVTTSFLFWMTEFLRMLMSDC